MHSSLLGSENLCTRGSYDISIAVGTQELILMQCTMWTEALVLSETELKVLTIKILLFDP